ncbi:DUF742 domain-containing protein [Actinomadura harenae]|uniref:DUF742 domain-containing protein n=1 Tax=Actinomadura harenae TaxID=2483351 RepID=A0A3M2LQH4_9ACTN|nr:DUF742 domain-containing protein [Actinomadura harenae]RMI38793.1 DUF742 domain-containing protein [Actinomadura harenae]
MTGPDEARDTPLRPFVLTRGRTATRRGLTVDTLLAAAPADAPLRVDAPPQARDLLTLCRRGVLSVAEAAAHLRLPVSVVLVLADDLIASHHLTARAGSGTAAPPPSLLQEVLDGLRRL